MAAQKGENGEKGTKRDKKRTEVKIDASSSFGQLYLYRKIEK
jgi:hypothetical protein